MRMTFGLTSGAPRPRPTGFVERLEDRRLLAAVLVKDINTNGDGSQPEALLEYQGRLYFSARNSEFGPELWRSDGTEAGTEIAFDWGPGNESGAFRPFAVLGDRLVVESAASLWITDGTRAGMTMLKPMYVDQTVPPVVIGNTLYFVANDNYVLGPDRGRELWKTDGTPEGTKVVKDIAPGAPDGKVSELTNLDGKLYFTADDGVNGQELWTSDGSEAGTVMLFDKPQGSLVPRDLVASGGQLFFSAVGGAPESGGHELWRSDGTTQGTRPFADIRLGPEGSAPAELTDVNGTVFFFAQRVPGVTQLYRTDGAGVTLLGDVASGAGAAATLTRVGGRVFFQGFDAEHGKELWVSDGTVGGTHIVADLTPGPAGSAFYELAGVGERLYFSGTDAGGRGLWTSDGSEAGTRVLRRFSHGAEPDSIAVAAGTVFFAASERATGRELWKTDGTPEGTTLVRDINLATAGSISDPNFEVIGDTAYFYASGLWKTDGTGAGTLFVAPMNGPVNPIMGHVGDRLLISRDVAPYGRELWASDGSAEGMVLLKDIQPSVQSSDAASTGIAMLEGQAVFAATTGFGSSRELWKTDGTPEGTVRVKDGFHTFITSLTPFNGRIFFVHASELWSSDGTTAGTVRVKRIHPAGSGFVRNLTVANGTLFFTANDAVHGEELWKSDGTEAGTVMVKDIRPGSNSSLPGALVATAGGLVMLANDGVHGHELWKSDGTEAGTVLLMDVWPGPNSGGHPNTAYAELNGVALMVLSDRQYGQGIWRTHGTAGGSFKLTNLSPGHFASHIDDPTKIGDQLFFRSTTLLWRTDGRTMTRLDWGDESPWPVGMVGFGDGLLVAADGVHVGTELFRISPPTANPGSSYTVSTGGFVELDGRGSSDPDPDEVLTYQWDLDGDGIFGELGFDAARGDELGSTPTLTAQGLAGGTHTVKLRVRNGLDLWDEAATEVVVTPAGTQMVIGDDGEDDEWAVGYDRDMLQVYRLVGGVFVPQREWPGSEAREVRFAGGGGNDRVTVFGRAWLAKIVLDGGAGTDTLRYTSENDRGVGGNFERLELHGGASLRLDADLATDVVELGGGSRLTLGPGGGIELRTTQLHIDTLAGDVLDLNDNRLLVEGGEAAALEALVAASRNAAGGAWTGAGITSTMARTQALRGLGVTVLGTGVLVSYGYGGDANLDGRVNGDDYFRIDQGFLAQLQDARYERGDFNYDERVNADDYFLIDQAFLGQSAPATTGGGAVGARVVVDDIVEREGRKRAKVRPVVETVTARARGAMRRSAITGVRRG